jgi:hypothetical protein
VTLTGDNAVAATTMLSLSVSRPASFAGWSGADRDETGQAQCLAILRSFIAPMYFPFL